MLYNQRKRYDILVTFSVLKFDKSSDVRASHSINILLMLSAILVSNFDKLSDVKALQPENIPTISVVSDVLRFSIPLISFSALQLKNQRQVLFGRYSWNDLSNSAVTICVFGFVSVPIHAGEVPSIWQTVPFSVCFLQVVIERNHCSVFAYHNVSFFFVVPLKAM